MKRRDERFRQWTVDEEQVVRELLRVFIEPQSAEDAYAALESAGHDPTEVRKVMRRLSNRQNSPIQHWYGMTRSAVYATTRDGRSILKRLDRGGRF